MRLAEPLIAVALVAAAPAAPGPEATAAAFLDSFRAMDRPRFESFFADEVTMFFPSGSFPKDRVDGKAAVIAAFDRFFTLARSRGRTALSIIPLDQRIQRHGDIAIVTFRLDSAEEVGRRTLVLKRVGGGWKIIHFHASFIDK